MARQGAVRVTDLVDTFGVSDMTGRRVPEGLAKQPIGFL
ncbi:DeoR family transcriptional regulator [Embleya sp. NPDC127516]